MRDGWVKRTFGTFASLEKGISYKSSELCNENEGLPFINLKSIDRGGGYRSDGLKWYSGKFKSSQVVIPGDLILCCTDLTKQKAILGYPILVPEIGHSKFCISLDLAKILVNENLILKNFLFLLLQDRAMREFMQSRSSGTTVMHLKTSEVPNAEVNLPPLPEQKRIVDLISSVDSYIEALQQQLENAKRSRNAVLHELLTAGGEGWVETTLGEVARLNPEQARDFGSDRLIKYIDLSTVTFDTGINSEIDQIPFNEAPGRARRIIRENDVIVSTVRPYLKGFAFVGKEFEGQIASTGFCVIRAKSELILSELIWALVGSDDFVEFLIKRSTGSNYPAVRPNDVSDFTFMLPPLNDQVTVSQLIRIFDDLIKDSSILVSSAQNLRSGLLSNLLSGEHEIPSGYDKVMGAA